MKDQPPHPLNYATENSDNWTPIAQFPDELTATLASGKLDAEGIPTNLTGQPNPIYGGNPTTLAVRSQDLEPAIKILKETPAKRWLLNP
jgi:hypothetical protein